jgi:hypothetical protein
MKIRATSPGSRATVRGGGEARRHPRFAFRERVRAVTEDGEYEGESQDISRGGVGLLIDATLDNRQFVELHIGDVGAVPGHVVRSYEGGVAVEFAVPEEEKERIEAEVRRFRRTMAEAEDGTEV